MIKVLQYKSAHVKYKKYSDISNNTGNWNYFKIIRKHLRNIPEKHDIKELQNQVQ